MKSEGMGDSEEASGGQHDWESSGSVLVKAAHQLPLHKPGFGNRRN